MSVCVSARVGVGVRACACVCCMDLACVSVCVCDAWLRLPQVQMYVNGAKRATTLVGLRGEPEAAILRQRAAYCAATDNAEPTKEWEAEANIFAELASVCEAHADELDTRSISWGDVPAGQWQTIGESGAVHFGPETDALRVILVMVLSAENHAGWEALQTSGPSALFVLGNAFGLVRWLVLCEVGTEYITKRSIDDGTKYEQHWAGVSERCAAFAGTREAAMKKARTPDAPDFLPWLQRLLRGVRDDYTVHMWPDEYAWAFMAYVVHHAAIYRGEVKLPEEHVREFATEGVSTRKHCARMTHTEAARARFSRKWRPVFNKECALTDDCACRTCSVPATVEGYKNDASGISQDATGPYYEWSTGHLRPDVQAELFFVPEESESGFTLIDSDGSRLVISKGEGAVIYAGFHGKIRFEKGANVFKAFELCDAYFVPHGDQTLCFTCHLACGAEHYAFEELSTRNFAGTGTKVKELLKFCSEMGLSTSRGSKAELITRIRDWNCSKNNQDNVVVSANETRDLCRVCYLKRGPVWAIEHKAAVRRNRHEKELPFTQAEMGCISKLRAVATEECKRHEASMDAARHAASVSMDVARPNL